MIRTLCIVLVCTALTGCLATTKIIIQHDFPDDHINYEIQQGHINSAFEFIAKKEDADWATVGRDRDQGNSIH